MEGEDNKKENDIRERRQEVQDEIMRLKRVLCVGNKCVMVDSERQNMKLYPRLI